MDTKKLDLALRAGKACAYSNQRSVVTGVFCNLSGEAPMLRRSLPHFLQPATHLVIDLSRRVHLKVMREASRGRLDDLLPARGTVSPGK